MQFSGPTDGSKRVTFVRMSGRQTDLSLCPSCEATPDRIQELNQVLELRARIEHSDWWREATGKSRKSEESEAQTLLRLQEVLLYHHDPLLGEIARRPLAEVF